MKPFAERNKFVIGVVGLGISAVVVAATLQYDSLPLTSPGKQYAAYFAESGGLRSGAAVQVSGLRVGRVSDIELDGPQVRVTFRISKDIRLGERTEAAIKTKTLLGAKILDIKSFGDGELNEAIPIARTTSPYQLPDALGDLAATVSELSTDELSESLATLAQTFEDTPVDLKVAVEGLGQFSQTLNERDAQLRSLLTNASKATAVLADRSDQIVTLVHDTNALLSELQIQRTALDQIAENISALSQQLSGFIAENRETLQPALEKLNAVLAIIDNRKERLQRALFLAKGYFMRLGETLGSGPFFKAYIANLLPGQFVQPFVEAAFSDLGLDPNVLAPDQLTDPQTGQPGTPALPVPFPRTGQGGEPRLNLPDAITGIPGDSRYPYREPLPAPPRGSPPPGPPASGATEGPNTARPGSLDVPAFEEDNAASGRVPSVEREGR